MSQPPQETAPQRRGHTARNVILLSAGVLIGAVGWSMLQRGSTAGPGGPHVVAGSSEQAGRYIVMISACNDCHTNGFFERGMKVPEDQWLTGSPVGWRGPWGTTYASNLRLFVKDFDEEMFVKIMKSRTARPPMVWPSIHAMDEQDLRAVYRYIRSLGPAGEPTPAYVPPGTEPQGPYFLMDPEAAKRAAAK